MNPIIREMQPEDINFCVECATSENWLSETHTVFDTFYAHDRHGCFIAEVNNGRVGMIVATPYDTCGFLGELIVIGQNRGHGIGRALMEHAIGYLRGRNCHSIYLDGDTPAVPLYERIGFKIICRSFRFLGNVPPRSHEHVREMIPGDLATVITLDRAAFGADRSYFLQSRFDRYPGFGKVLIVDDNLTGFVMAQPGHGIITVGPGYLDGNQVFTTEILQGLATETGNAPLRIGILESNRAAVAHFRSLGWFKETEPSWRMVLGEDISLGDSKRLWAVGSPATG